MKVLLLGGSGHIGSRLGALARGSPGLELVSASRHAAQGDASLRLDVRDGAALATALRGHDAAINCIAGDAGSIATGARLLAQAAAAAGCRRIIHLSTMSVYGAQEGDLDEQAPVDPSLGWYGRAKCEAERHIAAFADSGGSAVSLRPGCVWGPDSQLWVGRIGRWLRAGRLGDLGAAGDGWSNLVHVDDVCRAIIAALRLDLTSGGSRVFNLAAPDSPRWNDYFVDLALAIGATPVRHLRPQQLRVDAWVGGPVFKLGRSLLARARQPVQLLPDPISPGLLGLWSRQLKLNADAATRDLQVQWTPYKEVLRQSTDWFLQTGIAHRGKPVPVQPEQR